MRRSPAPSRAPEASQRTDTERRWDNLAAVVDTPRSAPLARLGISTRPLRAAWLLAALLVLLVPGVPAVVTGHGLPTLLLALAPIAPSLAVVLAYRTERRPGRRDVTGGPGRRPAHRVRAGPAGRAGRRPTRGAPPPWRCSCLSRSRSAGCCRGWPCPHWCCWPAPPDSTRPSWPAASASPGHWRWRCPRPPAAPPSTPSVDTVAGAPVQLLALAVAVAALSLTVSRRDQVAYRRNA